MEALSKKIRSLLRESDKGDDSYRRFNLHFRLTVLEKYASYQIEALCNALATAGLIGTLQRWDHLRDFTSMLMGETIGHVLLGCTTYFEPASANNRAFCNVNDAGVDRSIDGRAPWVNA